MTVDRREVFRTAMQRLSPTSDPAEALDAGWYVEPPHAISNKIATALDLESSTSHLLMGAIGSGKTTELCQVRDWIHRAVPDIQVLLVDVPAVHRVTKLKPGVLVAIAALKLADGIRLAEVPEDRAMYVERIKNAVNGYWQEWWEREDGEGDYTFEKGILEPPGDGDLPPLLMESLASLEPYFKKKTVILYDGLDRLVNTQSFSAMLAVDLPLLRRLRVGCVVVGPQQLRFRPEFAIRTLFTDVHVHRPAAGSASRKFLKRVLERRLTSAKIVSRPAIAHLVSHSGGVLRDLIWLARASLQEAYTAGGDEVDPTHAKVAVGRFGETLLIGITDEMAVRLVELHGLAKDAAPLRTIAAETDVALLVSRLLVEVPGDVPEYVPHPAIRPFLPGLARRQA